MLSTLGDGVLTAAASPVEGGGGEREEEDGEDGLTAVS